MNYIIRDNEIERKRTFHAILLVQKMTDFANTILGNLSALMKHRFQRSITCDRIAMMEHMQIAQIKQNGTEIAIWVEGLVARSQIRSGKSSLLLWIYDQSSHAVSCWSCCKLSFAMCYEESCVIDSSSTIPFGGVVPLFGEVSELCDSCVYYTLVYDFTGAPTFVTNISCLLPLSY